jgi:hypothetical protein
LFSSSASAAPHWLARIDTSVATWASQNGALAVSALAVIPFLVGVGALSPKTRAWALAVGLVLSVAIWIIGQDLGQLYSGQATDPNSAPLIALMAVVLLARPRNVGATGHTAAAARASHARRQLAELRVVIDHKN